MYFGGFLRYDRKKKVLVVCLAGARSLLRPENKKVPVVCLVGRGSLLRPEKKKFQSSVWRVRDRYYDRKKKVLVVCLAGARSNNNDPCQDMKPGPQGKQMYYYFYHGSDLRKIIRFLREIECIEFDVTNLYQFQFKLI